MLRRPHNKDTPPIFSHEFFIQNHADIITCVCTVIFLGLIPQFSNQLASKIIFVQYNMTVAPPNLTEDSQSARIDNKPLSEVYYNHGPLDLLNVLFYGMAWIVIHALLQEYVWERTAKRLRLSKTKLAKYYDSGCLVAFFFISLVWGINYIIKEDLVLSWQKLYKGYPHNRMILSLKFYMLNQMAFWCHCYPELYFMKIKREKIYGKIVFYTSSLLLIAGAYFAKLQRLALILLVLHYSVEFLFHACRLLHYHNEDGIAIPGFKLWRVLFVLVRILTVVISILTLWFGLGKVHQELKAAASEPPPPAAQVDDGEPVEEHYKLPDDLTKPVYRLCALSFVLLLQLWVGWTFLSSQMERVSEGPQAPKTANVPKQPKAGGGKKKQGDRKNDKTAKSKTS